MGTDVVGTDVVGTDVVGTVSVGTVVVGTDAVSAAQGSQAPATDLDDPREQIEAGVLMANGRLAGRRFGSRAEAEAWARPEDGEQVVEYNLVCECDR
jgi:hypothetical protein